MGGIQAERVPENANRTPSNCTAAACPKGQPPWHT